MVSNEQEIWVFCENIKFLRRKHGLTKTQMAKMLDIGRYSLTKIENSTLPLRLDCAVFYNIYKHFKITPSERFVLLEDK